MFQWNPLPLAGAFRITLPAFSDERGSFIKSFHAGDFQAAGISFALQESYFSFSRKDVIRGMHFQQPPFDHAKIVFCPFGAILDVILDLRSHSATFGQYVATELSQDNHYAYYIPSGFAHGFRALTEQAQTFYLVSSVHNRDNDSGIRYDSFGFDWGIKNPVISARDLSFAPLSEWQPVF